MQFIVEDGTGIPNATSYASTGAADDYATFWDKGFWLELSLNVKQRFLIQATKFLDANLDYPSKILTKEQSLAYPRVAFKDAHGRQVSGLPEQIQIATIEVAFMIAQGVDITASPRVLKAQTYGSSREEYVGGFAPDNSLAALAQITKELAVDGLAARRVKQALLVRG